MIKDPTQGQTVGIIIGFCLAGIFFLLIVYALIRWCIRRNTEYPESSDGGGDVERSPRGGSYRSESLRRGSDASSSSGGGEQ